MKLEPTSILSIPGHGRNARLSLLLEDDAGCRKGLTVRRLVQGPDGRNASDKKRLPIFSQGRQIGVVDPFEAEWDLGHDDDRANPKIVTGGALTCAFTLSDDAEPAGLFDRAEAFAIAEVSDYIGSAVRILGEQFVGTVVDEQAYALLLDAHIYPLLRLRRSKQDMAQPQTTIRYGAVVTTGAGKIVGIIVSIEQDLTHYAVAPIADVLDWHRLRLPKSRWKPFVEPSVQTARPKTWEPPKTYDARLLDLVGG